MFDRDVKQRVSLYEDSLAVLRLARDHEVISYQGRHCSLENVRVVPRSLQPNGIPILMGTLSSAGIARVARMGDGLLCGAIDDLDGIKKLVDKYSELVANNGGSRSVTLNRFAAIGQSYEDARALLEPHALKALRYYFRHLAELGDAVPASLRAAQSSGASPSDLTFEDFAQFFVCGTARDCIERIEQLQSTLALDRIVLQIRSAGGPSHKDVLDQIRQFGSEVIPHFR
jgi:alkanesulfonate monooxygenase SsuD/methylene tetrahydromethanopterin reductase-like flavin-dependent oxidoreductase (luciferase family)